MNSKKVREVYFKVGSFEFDFTRCTSSVKMWVKPEMPPFSMMGGRRTAPWMAELAMVSQFDCDDPIHTIPQGAIAAAKEYLTTGRWPPEYKDSQQPQGTPIEQIVRWFSEQRAMPVKWHDPGYCAGH